MHELARHGASGRISPLSVQLVIVVTVTVTASASASASVTSEILDFTHC